MFALVLRPSRHCWAIHSAVMRAGIGLRMRLNARCRVLPPSEHPLLARFRDGFDRFFDRSIGEIRHGNTGQLYPIGDALRSVSGDGYVPAASANVPRLRIGKQEKRSDRK